MATKGKCNEEDCNAAVTMKCHIGNDSLKSCPNWVKELNDIDTGAKKKSGSKLEIPWTGEDLKLEGIESISRRSSPIILGLAGHANSGKTSFLGVLFTLLLNGHNLSRHSFSGSETLLRWEYLLRRLRFEKGQVSFPPPTPSTSDYYSFLHLMLRTSEQKMKDVLFADLSGEVFSQWVVDKNDTEVGNVRWLNKHSDGFIFFINAENIAKQKMAGVNDILDLADSLKEIVNVRPVICVWSKADSIATVKRAHFDKVENELKQMFLQEEIYQLSNFLDVNSNPDPKSLNNLKIVDELLEKVSQFRLRKTSISVNYDLADSFLNYRGHGK